MFFLKRIQANYIQYHITPFSAFHSWKSNFYTDQNLNHTKKKHLFKPDFNLQPSRHIQPKQPPCYYSVYLIIYIKKTLHKDTWRPVNEATTLLPENFYNKNNEKWSGSDKNAFDVILTLLDRFSCSFGFSFSDLSEIFFLFSPRGKARCWAPKRNVVCCDTRFSYLFCYERKIIKHSF